MIKNQIQIKSGNAEFANPDRTSEKYQFISTKEITDVLGSKGWELRKQGEAGVRNRVKGFQKHILIFENENYKTSEGNIQVVIRNSHEGSASLQRFIGFMRIACANQLYSKSFGKGLTYSIRHDRHGLEKLSQAIESLESNLHNVEKNIRELKEKILTDDQVRVITEKALIARFGENSKVLENLDRELLHIPKRTEDVGNSAWVVFQRLQEQLTMGGIHYSDGKKMKTIRKIRSINTLPELNDKLWNLANTI